MMSINSVPQIPQVPQQTQVATSAPAFKGEDSNLTKAIEENTETSKKTANAALITSCATLLPLSVLAYKTHSLSKVAEAFQNDAKPILDRVGKAAKGVEEVANGAKPIVNDLQCASAATKETAICIRDAVKETTEVIKSEELKGLIKELTLKAKDINLANEVSKIGDSISGKINEVAPKVIENLLNKVSEFDVRGLSDNAIETLKKIKNFKISIG